MSIKIVSTSIFDSTAHALVNPVNSVGVMGAGLALEFKKRFPANFNAYREMCARGSIEPGRCFLYEDLCVGIINFPTKGHWRNPSKIEYISEGLEHMEQIIHFMRVSSVSMPMLGCGLGGLDEWQVMKLILKKLECCNCDITIHIPEVA